jgi:AcrR family transcriptional regulator
MADTQEYVPTCKFGTYLFERTIMKSNLDRPRDLSDTVEHKESRTTSSSSKDARALRSALALREAFLALLERKSLDQITIREICAEAGVHYATFFRHHQTKEALLDDIARDQIAHLNALTLAIRGADDYKAGFRALCEYVSDHRALWSSLLNGGAGGTMREEWVRLSLRVAAAEAPLNSWLPTELGTICAATLIAETMAWWVAQPEEAYSVDEITSILSRLLAASIMAPD